MVFLSLMVRDSLRSGARHSEDASDRERGNCNRANVVNAADLRAKAGDNERRMDARGRQRSIGDVTSAAAPFKVSGCPKSNGSSNWVMRGFSFRE